MEKEIQGFDDYTITDDGRVWSYKSGSKKELKLCKDGSYCVYLGNNKKRVAYLVADAFISRPPHYDIVAHIDGDIKNNNVDNLIWTSEQKLHEEMMKKMLDIMPESNEHERRICEIDGYEEYKGYTITKCGKVYSYIDGVRKQLSSSVNNGYLQVTIGSRKTTRCTRKIHRWVALAFIPQKHKHRQHVNHKDGNKQNNHVSNLEWVTNTENQRHAILTGLKDTSKIHMFDMNKQLIHTFNSMFEVMDFLHISSASAIYSCIDGTFQQAYGYIWRKTDS